MCDTLATSIMVATAAPNSNSSAPIQLSRYDSSQSDIPPDDILAMIYGFLESPQSTPISIPCQFEMISEESRTLFHFGSCSYLSCTPLDQATIR